MLGPVPTSTEAMLGFDPWMREAFQRDGYLALPNALPEPVITRWRERAHELFERAKDIERTGDGHVLSYRVLTGDVVKEDFRELYDFYVDQRTLAWVASVTGEAEIHSSPNLMSAVNVNILQAGHRYRWHFDANPYTALLYLSTSPVEAGGELQLYPNLRRGRTEAEVTDPDHLDKQQRVSIRSRAGMLVLIDGSVTYHRVAPVLAPCDRLSVPMVFPPFREELRPAHLDAYLYSSS